MVLTSNRRRTAGITALLAALMLILTALFVVSPAGADPGVTPSSPCDKHGFEKFNAASGSEDLEWGSIRWGTNAGDLDGNDKTTELSYDIDPGYSIDFCLKAGNVDNTFSGPVTGSGHVSHGNPSLSHIGYKIVSSPQSDPAASVLVNCDVAKIVLDNTGSNVAVTYTITGVDGYDTVEVPAGQQQVINDLEIAEDTDYDITVSAEGMDDATASGTYDCEQTNVCPDGTDKAGQPYENIEDCDDEEQTCPDGTDKAGQPYENIEDCDDEEVEVCPEGTDNAGLPVDQVDDCDDEEVEVCPEGTDNAGLPVDEVDDCDEETGVAPSVTPPSTPEVEVLPNVIEKPVDPAPAAQPAAQAAAQELPATGLGSTELLLLALLMLGLGTAALLGSDPRRQN